MRTTRTVFGLGALLVLALSARGAPDQAPREELFQARAIPTTTADDGVHSAYVLSIGAVRNVRELDGMAVRTVRLGEFTSRVVVAPRRSRAALTIDEGGRRSASVEGDIPVGTLLQVALVPGRWSNGVVTLAYHLEESDLREPVGRVHPGVHDPTGEKTVTAPRVDRVVATGVRDVWLGSWVPLAELPDPAGAPRTLYARIERGAARGGAPAHDLRAASGLAPLAALGRDDAAPRGALRITAIVRGAGPKPDETSLATLQVDGTLIRGVAVARLLDEQYLCDYDVEVAQCDFISDPILGIQRSGIRAEVIDDGRLRLTWTTTPAWDWFETTLGAFTEPVGIEIPDATHHTATVAIEPGRRVVPLARLEDGRSFAVVVDFDPAR